MAGFEQTIIIGNVGRDPELKYLPSGTAVCNFSVAVGSQWTDKSTGEKREKTNWYSVSAFDKTAEILGKYVKKGSQIMITGEVEAGAYMGNDGQAKADLKIKVRNFQFLGGNDVRDGDNGQQSEGYPYESSNPLDNDNDISF